MLTAVELLHCRQSLASAKAISQHESLCRGIIGSCEKPHSRFVKWRLLILIGERKTCSAAQQLPGSLITSSSDGDAMSLVHRRSPIERKANRRRRVIIAHSRAPLHAPSTLNSAANLWHGSSRLLLPSTKRWRNRNKNSLCSEVHGILKVSRIFRRLFPARRCRVEPTIVN